MRKDFSCKIIVNKRIAGSNLARLVLSNETCGCLVGESIFVKSKAFNMSMSRDPLRFCSAFHLLDLHFLLTFFSFFVVKTRGYRAVISNCLVDPRR